MSVHDINSVDGIHKNDIITKIEDFQVTEIYLERSKIILSFRETDGNG